MVFTPTATAASPGIGDREDGAEGSLPTLAAAALGVVFGDIGTSPLYALRQSFQGARGAALLYGDGTIPPVVSVRSAVEGLRNATSAFDRFVVPFTNVPVALRLCERFGLDIEPDQVTYYIGHERVIPARERRPPAEWVIKLFALLARNAAAPTDFYHLPPDRVVELGMQVKV